MTIDEVTGLLRIISDFSDEEIEYYSPLVQMYFNQYRNIDAEQGDRDKLVYLVASRIYYEISKLRINSDISSFKAGDITVTSRESDIQRAKRVYEAALENAGGLVEDTGFVFKGV